MEVRTYFWTARSRLQRESVGDRKNGGIVSLIGKVLLKDDIAETISFCLSISVLSCNEYAIDSGCALLKVLRP